MTQKGALSPEDEDLLMRARAAAEEAATGPIAVYRHVVVEMIEKSSYREVARLTGLSTNTLQRSPACECWPTPESMHYVYYGAREPGSMWEWNPDCPAHPASDIPPEVN